MRKDRLNLEKSVAVQCAHGDAVEYPVATVEINVEGRIITAEAAVLYKLQHTVLLGIGVLSWLKGKDQALMVVARSLASRLSRSQSGPDIGKQEADSSDI